MILNDIKIPPVKKEKNPCSKCGKERIVAKKWKVVTATSLGGTQVSLRTTTICPDAECQKALDNYFQRQREIKEANALERVKKNEEAQAKAEKELKAKAKKELKANAIKEAKLKVN